MQKKEPYGSFHHYSTISVTLPAPTVRPPSRIEKLDPCTSAIEIIHSIAHEQ